MNCTHSHIRRWDRAGGHMEKCRKCGASRVVEHRIGFYSGSVKWVIGEWQLSKLATLQQRVNELESELERATSTR